MSMEDRIYEIIEEAYGSVHEPAPIEKITGLKKDSNEGMDMALDLFRDNPSARNWNLLITAMMTYQYWTNKRVEQ